MTEILEEGTFAPEEYAAELAAAPENLTVGTTLRFQNERLRVWEVRLQPGERAPFHAHTRPYFWTVVDAGVARQRSPDGSVKVRRYEVGDTDFFVNSPDEPMVHDLENAGDSLIRFITVELLT